jgi:hypothetical protein
MRIKVGVLRLRDTATLQLGRSAKNAIFHIVTGLYQPVEGTEIVSRVEVTLDRVLDWILDLVTTYTHNSELQAITAPSLMSTTHISPQHKLRFPAWSVLTSRSLITAINSGDHSASAFKFSLNDGFLPTDSFLHRLPYRTGLVAPFVFLITPRHGPRRQHRSSVTAGTCLLNRCSAAAVYSCLLRICCLATNVVPSSVSQPFPRNEYCFKAFR